MTHVKNTIFSLKTTTYFDVLFFRDILMYYVTLKKFLPRRVSTSTHQEAWWMFELRYLSWSMQI